MKKIKWMPLLFAAVCGLLFAFSACGEDKGENLVPPEPSVLVAYFSATGTTEKVAKRIAEITGGALYEIVPEVPYTSSDLNYSDSSTRATREQNDPAVRPEIDGSLDNMADYDTIFLSYPIWWSKAPKIIYTFLEAYDLSGKTVVPFCTSGLSGIDGSLPELKALASGATFLSGKRFSSPLSNSEVEEWVNGLNG